MSINAGPQGLKVWAYVDVAKEHAFEASEPNAFPGGCGTLALSVSVSPVGGRNWVANGQGQGRYSGRDLAPPPWTDRQTDSCCMS